MTFASPQLLWLLLIPVAIFTMELARRRRTDVVSHSKILRAEAGAHSLKLSPAQSIAPVRRTRIHPWLCAGLILAIGAAARPQWGRLEEPVFDQAREILIGIDLSRSMLTPDVKPSRLDRAKLLTQSLLEKLAGERVGLVVYSGTAFLQSPLSADYEILREFLPELNPEFLPEGGTNYRALIDTSLDAFGSSGAADRFLIILSDGEATADDWQERIPELTKKGIRVIGLGIGTPEGAMIPDGTGGLVKDERGAVVLSKLESGTLRELADATNGAYQDASNWIDLAALVTTTVESGKQGEFMEKNTIRLVERFQWPLAFALWCLLVSFYYEFPVRPRPRDLKLTTEPTGSKSSSARQGATALMLVALSIYSYLPSPALAASESPEAPAPSPLAKIVSRLSSSPEPTARDWAELARETVTWGSKLQSSRQPVPDGPIRDALTAVDLGSKLDSKTADWPNLREELEALRKKSEEEKQDQEQKNEERKQDEQQKQQDQKQDQQKQNQQKQDQQKQDSQEKQNSESQQQKEKSESDNPSEQKKNDPASEPSEQDKDSAFGDMEKNQQPPSPPTEDTQQVGGAPKDQKGEPLPIDPNLAVPLQKLDQLKNQDSPAELFRLMEGEKDRTPRKNKKDW